MSNVKTWMSAMRFRTLPLAISGIVMGSALADLSGKEANNYITALALLTAVFLQILSNLANDYGDFVKGTDNDKRLGNTRALQSGAITPQAMLKAIIVFVVLSLISGIGLLWLASEGNISIKTILFLLLGLACIAAAIKYTVGKYAYGYSGLGDVFVFIFFGPVAVLGVYILHHNIEWSWLNDWKMILPATCIGLLSAAVLNTNNIRDIENDKASGKFTIVVKMGLAAAKKYHWFLVTTAFFCLLVFTLLTPLHWVQYLCLLAFIPIFKQAINVQNTAPSPVYNGYLKQMSLGTLFLVVAFVVTKTIALGIYVSKMINQLNG
jgi:1,4-dihydroxy-2-naphthoate octaprenyltransferase